MLFKVQCQALYSFNFLTGAGRTHGETIEENWSQSNRAAMQTKMMGPGARKDTLDDVFGAHNYRVVRSFGRVFTTRLAEAIKEARAHATEFTEFSNGMKMFVGSDTVTTWQREVLVWERDHSKPCPYEPQLQNRETLKDIQLQLAQEEQASLRTGAVTHESSMSMFLSLGIEIEEKQRALAWEVKVRRSGTTYQELNVERQCNIILRDLKRFRRLQQTFMPSMREYLTVEQLKVLDSPASILPEETKLFMPSELRAGDRALPRACLPGIVDGRHGYAKGSAGMPSSPFVKGCGHDLPDISLRGMNERLLTEEETAEQQSLAARGIIDELIVVPEKSDAVVARGEGRRQLSWIWYSYPDVVDSLGVAQRNDDPVIHEALKIEWCKARARKIRWEEEVALLLEEMRRVIAFRLWQARWWRERESHPELSLADQEGLRAFAEEQAHNHEDVAADLEARWQGLRRVGQELLDGLPTGPETVEVVIEEEEAEDDNEDDVELEEEVDTVQ
ncbi:hypothetical protein BDZ89DRAFT_1149708 [Hymenopellis radicata]|nr:hypothetical protein BDZ89DRAFT_1149708 [Hymenopellis radicata]